VSILGPLCAPRPLTLLFVFLGLRSVTYSRKYASQHHKNYKLVTQCAIVGGARYKYSPTGRAFNAIGQ
jgi:hypothetical protein